MTNRRIEDTNRKIEDAYEILNEALTLASTAFNPEVKLTLVMRHPEKPECWIVQGSDRDYEAVIETIRKSAGVAPTYEGDA